MQTAILLSLCIFLGGCATYQDRAGVSPTEPKVYSANAAAALVFDPPIAIYTPMPDLSRDGRSAAAFYGYEQPVVDSYHLYQRDEQRGGEFPSRFERTARFARTSVTYR
ncbi:MAG: hypothetical protein H7144_06025 [Burkholderiales bacterium]|nr:hypothetical protein [Phycisphaerae bacterium]